MISNNEVFWNNFDYYKGAPFKLGNTKVGASADVAYPKGSASCSTAGTTTGIENNAVYGNWLTALARLQALTLKEPQLATLIGNTMTVTRSARTGPT